MKRKVSLNRSKHRPFWLPAASFYFLAVAVALGIFFLVWAILAETDDDSPWITAGLLSSVSMIGAVVVREVILRNRRNSMFRKQQRLDRALLSAAKIVRHEHDPTKLTLERNAYLVDEMMRKSEAATVLGKLSESHREVFELCERYIEVATTELAKVSVGSPRLAAIARGRSKAERLHKHHMLRWAEIEVRTNSAAATETERGSVRLEKARAALKAVKVASEHYPDEPAIMESRTALEQFVLSARVTTALERAERAETRGDVDKAIESLYEADRLLTANGPPGTEDNVTAKVRGEIERLLGKGTQSERPGVKN